MAASRSYSGGENHRNMYISGEKSGPSTTNLTFEFNEYDVWNVASSPELHRTVNSSRISKKSVPETVNRRDQGKGTALSLPVDVPDWSMILKEELIREKRNEDDCGEVDLYGADDLIPPHEYLARVRMASCSVHEGIGRTLKGRDLSRVRDAVWKKIGFED